MSNSINEDLKIIAIEIKKSQKTGITRALYRAIDDYPDVKGLNQKRKTILMKTLRSELKEEKSSALRKKRKESADRKWLKKWLKSPQALRGARKNAAFQAERCT